MHLESCRSRLQVVCARRRLCVERQRGNSSGSASIWKCLFLFTLSQFTTIKTHHNGTISANKCSYHQSWFVISDNLHRFISHLFLRGIQNLALTDNCGKLGKGEKEKAFQEARQHFEFCVKSTRRNTTMVDTFFMNTLCRPFHGKRNVY